MTAYSVSEAIVECESSPKIQTEHHFGGNSPGSWGDYEVRRGTQYAQNWPKFDSFEPLRASNLSNLGQFPRVRLN